MIRKPNGKDRWNDLDPSTIMVKHGDGTGLDLMVGTTQISVPNEPVWRKYTYGEFRRKFGTKWADAWLFRTNCPTDPERMDMLRARVGVPESQIPTASELNGWDKVRY